MMEVLEVMVMAVMLLMVSRVETMSRPSPEQCYYQPYYKQLTCSCNNDNKETTSTSTYLGLKMIHYVKTLGQEVRALITHSVSLRVSFIEKNILLFLFLLSNMISLFKHFLSNMIFLVFHITHSRL